MRKSALSNLRVRLLCLELEEVICNSQGLFQAGEVDAG